MKLINEIEIRSQNLPDTIEDLSKFVFMGREKLIALNAAIRACSKQSMLSEKMEQMKIESQGLAESLLIAETTLGKMLIAIPNEVGKHNQYVKEQVKESNTAPFQTEKQKAIKEAGISVDQSKRFQTLARHEDKVQQAIEDARRNDRPVTRAEVFKMVVQEKKEKEQSELRQARTEHKAFVEKKNSSPVVSMKEIQEDKENSKKIVSEWMGKVRKASESIYGFSMETNVSFADVFSMLGEEDRQSVINELESMKRMLDKIYSKLGGE